MIRSDGVWTRLVLPAVLLLALLLRLRGLAFGLPALLDPDEPLFVLKALTLLKDHTLNPGWFGHPGTTTIYALALVEAGVFLLGRATGRFPDAAAFTHAIYADPGIVWLPGRVFILVCALLTIVLTFVLGRRLFDARTGVLAAASLAIDPVHIRYSQIIRTDMHSTVFILLALIAAVGIAQDGRRRWYAWAALWLGAACATKWPAAMAITGVLGAAAFRWHAARGERRAIAAHTLMFMLLAPLALLAISPYLLLDVATLASDLAGEQRSVHPGATGGGALWNAWWYVRGPLYTGVGLAGLVLIAAGLFVGARRQSVFAAVVLPATAAIFVTLISQHLIWERWVIPLLPMLALAQAAALARLARWLAARLSRPVTAAVALGAGLAVAVPPLASANAQAIERNHDTRREASDWAKAHIPAGSVVGLEFLAFDLLPMRWQLLYPAGTSGCVDVRRNLRGEVRVETISRWRRRRPVVDFGGIDAALAPTCAADYLLLQNYDRYSAEAARFPEEVSNYARLIGGRPLLATFAPKPGRVGGWTTRVFGPAAR